jgi:hypothetical protein
VCAVNHYNYSWLWEQLQREVKTLSHGFYWSYENNNNFKTKATGGIKKAVGQFNCEGALI